eukprot:29006-Pelagococcus_subviridis.AAC.6
MHVINLRLFSALRATAAAEVERRGQRRHFLRRAAPHFPNLREREPGLDVRHVRHQDARDVAVDLERDGLRSKERSERRLRRLERRLRRLERRLCPRQLRSRGFQSLLRALEFRRRPDDDDFRTLVVGFGFDRAHALGPARWKFHGLAAAASSGRARARG